MKIRSFHAENFRNIASCDLTFTDGVNLLRGENAQGKTNVVEGIYLFSRGKSFRTSTERDMIRFGCEGFRLSLSYEEGGMENTLSYALFGNERRRMKNGYKLSGASEMVGNFRAVLFCPDHLGLVKDGPEKRREFLNVGISATNRAYIDQYSVYKHAHEERNCLLRLASKGMMPDPDEIRAWSASLAEYASYIYCARRDYVRRLSLYAREFLSEMTDGKELLSLTYETEFSEEIEKREDVRDAYVKLYSSSLPREMAAGTTLFGPVRDDIGISLGDSAARGFASQGQQRSVVLALKRAEGEVIRETCGEDPVYLYDDVLSELDDKRRSFVLAGAKDKQIVITSCDLDRVNDRADHVITVRGGSYVSSYR